MILNCGPDSLSGGTESRLFERWRSVALRYLLKGWTLIIAERIAFPAWRFGLAILEWIIMRKLPSTVSFLRRKEAVVRGSVIQN
jgi:hypothetical protein